MFFCIEAHFNPVLYYALSREEVMNHEKRTSLEGFGIFSEIISDVRTNKDLMDGV
jgi:hypothetical protein